MMPAGMGTPEQQRKTLIEALLFDGLEPDYIVEEVLLATTEHDHWELARVTIIDEVAKDVAREIERDG